MSAQSEATTTRAATCPSKEVRFSDEEPEHLCVASLDDIGDAEHAATWLSEDELSETMRDTARTIHDEHQVRCRLRRLRRATESDSSDTTTSCSSSTSILIAQKQDEDSPTTSNQDQDLESAIAQASRQHSQESITLALQLATIDEEYSMTQQRRDLSMIEDRCLDHGGDLSREDMLQRSIDLARQGIGHREATSSRFLRSLMARVVGMQTEDST